MNIEFEMAYIGKLSYFLGMKFVETTLGSMPWMC